MLRCAKSAGRGSVGWRCRGEAVHPLIAFGTFGTRLLDVDQRVDPIVLRPAAASRRIHALEPAKLVKHFGGGICRSCLSQAGYASRAPKLAGVDALAPILLEPAGDLGG